MIQGKSPTLALLGFVTIAAVVIALAITPAQSHAHEWTLRKSGKKVSALYLGFEAGQVHVKTADGGTHYVPIERFSESDYELIRSSFARFARLWRNQAGKSFLATLGRVYRDRAEITPFPDGKQETWAIDDFCDDHQKTIRALYPDALDFDTAKAKEGQAIHPAELPLQPFGSLTWDDDLLTCIRKVNAIPNLESVNLIFSDQGRDVSQLESESDLRRMFAHYFGNLPQKKDPIISDSKSLIDDCLATLRAEPIIINGVPYQLEVQFRCHRGLVLFWPQAAVHQARQVIGGDIDLYLPLFMNSVELRPNSDERIYDYGKFRSRIKESGIFEAMEKKYRDFPSSKGAETIWRGGRTIHNIVSYHKISLKISYDSGLRGIYRQKYEERRKAFQDEERELDRQKLLGDRPNLVNAL